MNIIKTILFIAASLFLLTAWLIPKGKKPTPIKFIVPKGWPKPVYNFKNNPLTEEGVALGKQLFYDGRLSKDGNFPCASCHQQIVAFANYEHNLSHGFNNAFTTRNAPALQNLAWQTSFMHDGGIPLLDLQPLGPITNDHEMAETMENVIAKLNADTAYHKLFYQAFGSDTITSQRMLKALSQFMLMMVSSNSKYDKVMRGEATFILPEQLGYDIFMKKCASCHPPPLFTDYSFRNIGLPVEKHLNDLGRMIVTGNNSDSLKFRVPSLRNIELTNPYGHDGRFFSLYNVFEHDRHGIVNSPTLDSSLINGVSISNYEEGQLTAFLYTLTDSSFITDKRFAPPFYNNPLYFNHQHK